MLTSINKRVRAVPFIDLMIGYTNSRTIILALTLLFGSLIISKPATASVFHDCIYNSYTDEQKKLIIQSYELGKSFELGFTLAAISIVESSAGNNIANWRESSFGPYQNRAITVLNRHKIPSDDVILQFRTVERLIYDIEFAAQEAINELNYWIGVRKGDWTMVWASYNAGWKWENGVGYASMINYHVSELQKCGFDAD